MAPLGCFSAASASGWPHRISTPSLHPPAAAPIEHSGRDSEIPAETIRICHDLAKTTDPAEAAGALAFVSADSILGLRFSRRQRMRAARSSFDLGELRVRTGLRAFVSLPVARESAAVGCGRRCPGRPAAERGSHCKRPRCSRLFGSIRPPSQDLGAATGPMRKRSSKERLGSSSDGP